MTESHYKPTLSGALIGSNDDLLIEILRQLPIVSVIRFKSVSKHWKTLLSNPRFTHFYRNFCRSPGFFVHNFFISFDVENRSPPPFRSLDFYPDPHGIKIMQSCNGFLLCCSKGGNECDRKYYVLNPTTKQFEIIPTVPGRNQLGRIIRSMVLAFHQKDCPYFKVVCIFHVNHDDELLQIQIYSSDTAKWKNTTESLYAQHYTEFECGVYWNGAIYWAPSCFRMLYFKLDVEKLQTLPFLPPQHVATPLYFGESRGHLHLVETVGSQSHLHLNVYEMSNDDPEWFIKYQVELDQLPNAYPDIIFSHQHPSSLHDYLFEVLDVVRGEEEDDTFIVVKIANKIISYKILDKTFKQIYGMGKLFFGRIEYSEVHRYIETLTSF